MISKKLKNYLLQTAVFISVIIISLMLINVFIVSLLNTNFGQSWLKNNLNFINKTGYKISASGFSTLRPFQYNIEKVNIESVDEQGILIEDISISLNATVLIEKTVSLNVNASSVKVTSLSGSKTSISNNNDFELTSTNFIKKINLRTHIDKVIIDKKVTSHNISGGLDLRNEILFDNEKIKINGNIKVSNIVFDEIKGSVPYTIKYDASFNSLTNDVVVSSVSLSNEHVNANVELLYNLDTTKHNLRFNSSVKKNTLLSGLVTDDILTSISLSGSSTLSNGDIKIQSTINDDKTSVISSLAIKGNHLILRDIIGTSYKNKLNGNSAIDLKSGLIDGSLKISSHSTSLFDKLSTNINFKKNDNKYQEIDIRSKISGVKYSKISADDLNIDISSKDFSKLEIIKSRFKASNLNLNGYKFNELFLKVKPNNALSQLELMGYLKNKEKITINSELSLKSLSNLKFTNTVLKTSASSIHGNGFIDFDNRKTEQLWKLHNVDFSKIINKANIESKSIIESGTIKLTGFFSNPKIVSNLKWKFSSVSDNKMYDIDTGFHYENRNASVSAKKNSPGTDVIEASLNIPMLITLDNFPVVLNNGKQINGNLVIYHNLSHFSPVYKSMVSEELDGLIDANLKISGSLYYPSIDGQLKIIEGAVVSPENGATLKNINTDIIFKDHSMIINNLKASDSGNGSLSASGNILVNADLVPVIDFYANLKSLNVLNNNETKANIDAQINAKYQDSFVYISGKIFPNEVNVNLDNITRTNSIPELSIIEKSSALNSKKQKIILDLLINAEKRVFLRGLGLDAELGGDLKITGDSQAPDVQGKLYMLRGRYQEFGKNFSINKSNLIFQGSVPPSPFLDIQAQTKANNMIVKVSISGNTTKPTITLSSIPSYPKDEIISRLMFNTDLSNISPYQAVQVAGVIARLSGNTQGSFNLNPFKAVRDLTGLDDIRIEGTDKIGVGKYVLDNVYVDVEQGADPTSGIATVEAEITDNISVESKAGINGSLGASIFWGWEY